MVQIVFSFYLIIHIIEARSLPGREYKFRVSAVNEHGDSDHAVTKETIIAAADADAMDSAVRNMY